MKSLGFARPQGGYNDIHMPKNTATGVFIGALSFACAFGLVWYIWWLAAASLLGVILVAIGHSFNYHQHHHIPADEVRRFESGSNQAAAQGASA
jgi:cytochrome o ubiquinol oxidase subunit 1